MKKRFVALAATAAMSVGYTVSEGYLRFEEVTETYNGIPRSEAVMTPHQEGVIADTQRKIESYWGNVATTRLVTLNGNETFYCGKGSEPRVGRVSLIGSVSATPLYCSDNDAVLIPAIFAQEMLPNLTNHDPALEDAGLIMAEAHEYGHALQQRGSVIVPAGRVGIEQQADCLAGEFMGESGQYEQTTIVNASTVLSSFPEDGDHGRPQDRYFSFNLGASGEDCNDLPALLRAQRAQPATFSVVPG